jgi:hypothetical protein
VQHTVVGQGLQAFGHRLKLPERRLPEQFAQPPGRFLVALPPRVVVVLVGVFLVVLEKVLVVEVGKQRAEEVQRLHAQHVRKRLEGVGNRAGGLQVPVEGRLVLRRKSLRFLEMTELPNVMSRSGRRLSRQASSGA